MPQIYTSRDSKEESKMTTPKWHRPKCSDPRCGKIIYKEENAIYVPGGWWHRWCRFKDDYFTRSKY